ncbi:MAG: alpha/beta hydrolase [Pseudomonadota bacterium]
MFGRQFTIILASVIVALPGLAAAQNDAATLELVPCRIDAGPALPTSKARCGTFERAEDPSNPDGAKVSLRVALIPALAVEPAGDPLVFFAGGPGQGAIDSYLSLRGAFEAIRQKRDILLVDQRGTGQSNQLQCPTPSPEEVDAGFDLELAGELATACLDELPGDPRFYTTSVAVDDLDALREALGIEQLNLWGGSYGTRVALHYLKKYPENTRSVIIDGVIAADQLLGPDLSIAAEASLQQLFSRCREDAACNDRYPALEATFDELMAELRETPTTVSLAHPRTGEIIEQRIGYEELMGVVRLATYQPLMRAMLPLMISEASNDRFQMIAANTTMLNETFPEMMAMGMHNAVVCSEDAPRYSDDDGLQELRQEAYMGDVQFEYLRAVCRVWPEGVVDANFHEPVTSDKPVLLLSGEFDPVTPPANAERALETLSNATHIVAPEQGHIISSLGCMPRLIGKFVDTADPSAIDAECVERLRGTAFFTSPTGPTP